MAKAQQIEVEQEVSEESDGRSKLQIQGTTFSISAPYKEGYQLKANEAAAMNQLLKENVRNNLATTVRDAKLRAAGWSDEQIKGAKVEQMIPAAEKVVLTPDAVAELQAQIDEYVAGYEFFVRSGARKDPEEREMEAIAKAILDDALRSAGRQPSKLFKENRTKYDQLLSRILTENEAEIRTRAKAILEQRAGIQFSLGDVSDVPENGDDEDEAVEAAQ